MVIAIDFDGTVVDHEYPEIGRLKPGAVKALKAFKKAGHQIAIWTFLASSRHVAGELVEISPKSLFVLNYRVFLPLFF